MSKNKFGVPCSYLKDKIKDVDIFCTSESEAMALAAGAWFADKKSIVYMQNSGLGNIIDIVTSLYNTYGIPHPKLLLSVRHTPEHHEEMFRCTYEILDLLGYNNYEQIVQPFNKKTSNKKHNE